MVELPEIETMARTVARETVSEMFRVLGVDVSNPFEVQKDFAHLRYWRKAMEAGRIHAYTSFIFLALTAVGSAIWFVIAHPSRW